MRTALENIFKAARSDGAWFAAALMLGAAWGFSVEPVHLPESGAGLAQLKLLGWLAVAVLCMSVGAMAWAIRLGPLDATGSPRRRAVAAGEGGMAFNSPQAPKTQTSRSSQLFAGEPETPSHTPENIPDKETSEFHAAPGPAAVTADATADLRDPFLAALDYLGHAHATVRIGGILALERYVRQGGDLQACTGTLAAYVQQWAETDAQKSNGRPGYDVVAALAVLSRLLPSGDALRNLADLRRVNLAGLELPDADLSRFHLEYADLSGADLRGSNFSGANFRGADLRGALLAGAVFAGAGLRGADLTGAVLSDDEFGAADLSMAGNVSPAQLLHIRFHPGRPPRLPAGIQLTSQSAAVAV